MSALQADRPRFDVILRISEVALAAAAVAAALTVISVVVGVHGLGLIDGSSPLSVLADNDMMSIEAELAFPVELTGDLTTRDTVDGSRDIASGRSPAELTGPVVAQVALLTPSGLERAAWTVSRVVAPLVAGLAALVLLGLVRSLHDGDPFNRRNERRLWVLAAVAAVGGTVAGLGPQLIDGWMVGRSAASDLVETQLSLTSTLVALAASTVLAVLAGVWHLGVDLSDEARATI
ncbi:MAG: DUF2975 domain-containing protein [Acidimicrobiales bacterium]